MLLLGVEELGDVKDISDEFGNPLTERIGSLNPLGEFLWLSLMTEQKQLEIRFGHRASSRGHSDHSKLPGSVEKLPRF